MSLFGGIVDRLRRRFSVRRQTPAGPLLEAYWLWAAVRRIERAATARVLAPAEFAPYVRHLTELSIDRTPDYDPGFDRIVVRQTNIASLDRRLIGSLLEDYRCLYANRAYAVFGPAGSAIEASADVDEANQRLSTLATAPAIQVLGRQDASRPILITTFDRPEALRRSLPQVAALGQRVLVVDDGSAPSQAEANGDIARRAGAAYMRLPENRGLAAAINIGIAYLLADDRAQWISYFQDDVDVDPSLMMRLTQVEHAEDRPVLTGYDADEHPAEREDRIGREPVKLKRLSPAVHIHAHAGYWRQVLPIPTQYLGAPKRRWEPSLEDYWIIKDAPAAVWRRNILIPCLPGLVRTFLWHQADSTWGNPNLPEAPLAGRSDGR